MVRTRRWWRRRPVFRTLVLSHRWPALLLGLLLVVETTSGAVLLYQRDLYRISHGDLYDRTASAHPISRERALQVVAAAHPEHHSSWVGTDKGMYVVGNPDYRPLWYVDPGTGRITGVGDPDRGVLGFLINLHDCAFGCEGLSGYLAWTTNPAVGSLTWAGLALAVLGLLMVLLVVSSLRIWWPGWRRLRSRAVVRTGRSRFARDYDLHNVVGMVSLPFVLMWGVTGAAFEMPVVEKAWLSITGGQTPVEEDFSLTAREVPAGTPELTMAQAVAVARRAVPDATRVSFVGRPTEGADYFEVDLVRTGRYAERLVYSGDTYVLVDPHVAAHHKVIGRDSTNLSNRLYDNVFEPSHFGWNVNGWWRIIWFVLGLAPLVLMVTGISTWLFRRGVKRRRKAAGRARLADDELDEMLEEHPDRDPVATG